MDVVARIIAQSLSTSFGQQFVVENRPGAGSNIATETVARAAPDGYTLLLVSVSAAINAALDRDSNFSLARDIAPVAGIMRVPGVMEVNPSFPANTVPEFIAYAKANPGKINMASAGNGTLQHLCGEMFKQMTGVQMVHVPYRGSPAALTALMAGEAQVTFDPLPSSIELIRSGKLRALAVTSATPAEALPEIATVGEYVTGFEASAWYGLGAPIKTPTEIVQRLNVATNAALGDAAVKKRLNNLGGSVISGPPSLFGNLVADEIAKWAHVIKAAGITAGPMSEPKSQVAQQTGEVARTNRSPHTNRSWNPINYGRKRNAAMENFDPMHPMSHPWIALLMLAWVLLIPLYLLLQAWFGYAWAGRWRTAALIPLAGLVALILFVFMKGPYHPYTLDPSPAFTVYWLAVMLFAPLGVIYLVIAGISHRIWSRPTTS